MQGSGHTIVEAENGKVALDKLGSTAADCIILDINMPEMNGLEFLAARKTNPKIAKIPVIVLTTQSEDSLQKEAMALGANAFLGKPFEKDALLATIKAVVK